ncbi:MAG: LysR family transcriptional regulator [Myxococcota bacterium]
MNNPVDSNQDISNQDIDHSWDDLRVFLAVVEAGSLNAAATALGMSQPTVGRRLSALEERLGTILVERGPAGCVPTKRGRGLLPALTNMRSAADEAHRALAYEDGELEGPVRVACGQLVAHHLITAIEPRLDEVPRIRLEFVTGSRYVNLHRQEADIALRSRRPRSAQLYARRLGTGGFGIYAAPTYTGKNPAALDERERLVQCRWISTPTNTVPSVAWIERHVDDRAPRLLVSDSLLVLEATLRGAGLAVLPTFVGEPNPRLVRLGPVLGELSLTSWLVCHGSVRRLPRIRWALEAIARAFGADARASRASRSLEGAAPRPATPSPSQSPSP